MDADSSPLFQYRVMGEESETLTGAQLKKLAQRGMIACDTPIRRVGAEDWVSAERIPWLFEADSPERSPAAAEPATATADRATEAEPVSGREQPPHVDLSSVGAYAPQPSPRRAVVVVSLGTAVALALGFGLGFFAGLEYANRSREERAPELRHQSPSDGPERAGTAPQTRPQPAPPQQAEAVASLREAGAVVGIDEEMDGKPAVLVRASGPRFTDHELQRVKQLGAIEEITLKGTGITDRGLESFKRLWQLRVLDLDRSAKVTDAGLEHLQGLAQLKELTLDGTGISDAGLEHLKALTGLERLSLAHTEISDGGLAHLGPLIALKKLDLRGTKVTAAGLTHLIALRALKVLGLEECRIADAGVTRFKNARPDVTVIRP